MNISLYKILISYKFTKYFFKNKTYIFTIINLIKILLIFIDKKNNIILNLNKKINISLKLNKFLNIFKHKHINNIPPYKNINHPIKILFGQVSFYNLIYLLIKNKLKLLQKYIKKNVKYKKI